MVTQQADPIITALFLGFIGLIGLLVMFRHHVAAGARAAAGAGGWANVRTFLGSYGWLVVGVIIIPVGYWMLMSGRGQTLLLLAGVLVGIFGFNVLMKSPPSSWTSILGVAAILLFASWDPTWNLLNGAASGYKSLASGDSSSRIGTSSHTMPVPGMTKPEVVTQPTKPKLHASVKMLVCDGDKVWSEEVPHPPLGALYPRWNSEGYRTQIHDGLQWVDVDIKGGLTGHTVTKLRFCLKEEFRMSEGGMMPIYQK